MDYLPWLKSFILSIHNTIRLFILDGDFVIIQETTETFNNTFWKSFYDGVSAITYLAAPLLTFGFILTFFKTLKARIRFFMGLHTNRGVYIFSELNRKSILLAESIYKENKELRKNGDKKPKRCVIVFCEVDEKDEGDDSDLTDRANEIDAILFKKEVTSLTFERKKKVYIDNEPKDKLEEEDLSVENLKKKQDETIDKGIKFVEDLRKGHELKENTVEEKIDAFKRDVKGAKKNSEINDIYDEFIAIIDRTRKDYTPADYIPPENRRRINFFFMHADQGDNVRHYYDIFKLLKSRSDVSLYLFSTSPASELALNHSSPTIGNQNEACLVQRRRVTIDTFFIYRYLYEHGFNIFDNTIKETEDGKKIISVVIVGLGMYGTQFLQAMAWYSQMDGYYLKINAFDSDPLAEDRFAGVCPELMDEKHNKKIIPGDAQYDITIHPNCPIKTKKFNDELKKITDASICFTCLGNDNFNIEAALELRCQFERNGLHPIINAIVQETSDDITTGAINFKKQGYDINFIGSDEEAYSVSSILGSELEEEAKIAHVEYSQTRAEVLTAINEFYMYEYNYLSSCATVIHRKAKKHCHIPGMDKTRDERTPVEKKIIELLEHKRWNAWMRSKGYIWSGSIEKKTRNDLGKKHHDIVPYEELTEDEKRKDELVSF